jgi:threonine synthase
MDVGNPSNFIRMKLLAGDSWEQVKSLVSGAYYTDDQTREAMLDLYQRTGYVMCPHTAVAYLGLNDFLKTKSEPLTGVFLSTAHYAKFLDVVEGTLNQSVPIPERLASLLSLTKQATQMSTSYEDFKAYLLK